VSGLHTTPRCVTMGHMGKTASVRDLHMKTSDIVKQVEGGEMFVIHKRGTPVAEIRPLTSQLPTRHLPDREAFIRRLPRVKTDSGRILEQDRT
jgi:antitoxin (DNA-binding transcriptional repressor) of toxin-antitoxin stability system